MSPEVVHSIQRLVETKILPGRLSTSQTVQLIGDKSMHRKKILSDEYREVLGAKRKGAGLHFDFDTLKVLEFVAKRKKVNNIMDQLIGIDLWSLSEPV